MGNKNAFKTFCVVWGVSELFDLASFAPQSHGPLAIAVGISSVILVFRPSAVTLFAVSLLHVTHVFADSPFTANHVLFKGFVNLAILLVIAERFRLERSDINSGRLYEAFAPFLRVALLILYFFTVFHKLNWDFIDPGVSCASYLLTGVGHRVLMPPMSGFVTAGSIWLTLLIETAIPLMLVIKKTRLAGILVGCVFHFILAIHPHAGIYGFSGMMYALFVLFIPADLIDQFSQRLSKSSLWKHRFVFKTILILIILLSNVVGVGLMAWFVWTMVFTLALGVTITRDRPEPEHDIFVWRHGPAPALIGLILITVNGFSPYMGFQTTRTLSMFSNLRTEGGRTNHLLVPSSLQIGGYQRDLVEIVASTDVGLQEFADQQLLLPYLEFARRVESARPKRLIYFRNGERFELDSADSALFTAQIDPPGFLTRKVLAFRPIDKNGPAQCRW